MEHKRLFPFILLIYALAAFMGACSIGETPRQIASFPSGEDEVKTHRPVPPIEIGRLSVVYNAYMHMKVWDVEEAANDAIDMTYDYGGFLESSQSWRRNDKAYIQLSLHVPAEHYESVHRRLLKLGELTHERVSGTLQTGSGRDSQWDDYSEITLHLQSRTAEATWIHLPALDWRPVRTFISAFRLFANIFGFLVDVLIWVTVIVGPFLLMGLGLRWLVRKWTKH